MNYRQTGKILSMILALETVSLLPALVISILLWESSACIGFLTTIVLTSVSAAGLYLTCREASTRMTAKDGLFCASISWILISLMGCLPFWISGEIPAFIDALFEIVSGFTTTGATILSDVESLSKSLLYWRSFSHFLGGMGVLVFILAVAPMSGRGGSNSMHILRAESPGPDVGKLVPKMRSTAMILYVIYCALTALDFIMLLLGGMPLFDALCTAFGTAGTGGFGIKNDSLGSYSPYIQYVTAAFMLLFAVNFNMYYYILIRRANLVVRDEEFLTFMGIVIAAIVIIALNIRPQCASTSESIRYSVFTCTSIVSSTGYGVADFDTWPTLSKTIILFLMFMGACAGSTGGGLKVSRILLLAKTTRRNVLRITYPRRVSSVLLNGSPVNESVLQNVTIYLTAWVLILITSFLVLSVNNFSVLSNFTAVLTCLNNIGPGLEQTGPTCNFGGYNSVSKLVLIFDMLAGRLEIYPILVLLTGGAWIRRPVVSRSMTATDDTDSEIIG